MKDVQATLRRIDEEIVHHQQNIVRARNEISKLQEARLTLMSLAEDDAAHAEEIRTERIGTINGEHAKPVLIVRKEGSVEHRSDEDDKLAAQREKWRIASAEKRAAKAAKLGKPYNPRNPASAENREAADALRNKVLSLLDGEPGGMTVQEMGNHLGLPVGERNRKALSNAVYRLKHTGKLKQNYDGRYILTN